MARSGCPTAEELSAFVLGKLPESVLEEVAAHTAGCARCQQDLQLRDVTSDSLVFQIRQARRDDPVDAESGLTQVLQRAEALAPGVTLHQEQTAHPGLAPGQAPDEIGRLGPYRVLRQIGAGGMGMVYEGEDPQLGRRVALKVMKPSLASEEGPRKRFLHEARALAALTHDHIVPIYQVGEERGVLFLAMPFLEGETLECRLQRAGPGTGRALLPMAEILRIGREIAEGLAAAHARGLIHRDVKPSNVWLEAGSDRVKILDFGLARALQSDARLTKTGNVLGTPEYMSPEQANGKPADGRADLFSLGCVLYLLCTGVSPFKRGSVYDSLLAVTQDSPQPPRDLNHALPPALAELTTKLLAKEPDQRPAGAREAADALAAMQQPARRVGGRWVGWLVGGGVAAVLVAAALVVVPRFLNGNTKPDIPNTEMGDKDGAVSRPETGTPAPPVGLVDEAFCKWVATLAPRKQITTVEAKMKELNPDFDGEIRHPILTDPPTPFKAITLTTDAVTNVSPVRALPALVTLRAMGSAPGKGKLSDLSPLRGTKLIHLDVTNNPVRDFSPLRDLALETIWFDDRPEVDLAPLREIKTLARINGKAAAAFMAEHTVGKGKP